MTVDSFTDRVARVRHRFVSTIAGKIEDAYAAIPQLTNGAAPALTVLEVTYRCMHGIVGIGPTVGFPATGRAARDVENVLRAPQKAKRGLTGDEVQTLRKNLDALREASQRELQSSHSA